MSKKSTALATPEVRVEGMGSIPHENGVYFRVWAPHAKKVFVTGDFNKWAKTKNQMTHEGNGYWGLNIPDAAVSNEYKYILHTDMGIVYRNDPYAREVTNSAGNSIITDPHLKWTDHDFQMPSWNELVIYEMHIGTFNVKEDGKPGTFENCQTTPGLFKSFGC